MMRALRTAGAPRHLVTGAMRPLRPLRPLLVPPSLHSMKARRPLSAERPKNVAADLRDAFVPLGGDRLVLFVDDERWRHRMIAGINVAHVGFWYVNWTYTFPFVDELPTQLGPAGLAFSVGMAAFFVWHTGQSIAGVMYNTKKRCVELLPYSVLGASDTPTEISMRDIQLSTRSTDDYLFVKRKDDRLFQTVDRSSGTVLHDRLLMAVLSGEQLVVDKILRSDEAQESLVKAAASAASAAGDGGGAASEEEEAEAEAEAEAEGIAESAAAAQVGAPVPEQRPPAAARAFKKGKKRRKGKKL